MSAAADASGPILALDTASPVVSVALATEPRVLARRQVELLHSSGSLLRLVDDVLEEAKLAIADLGGVAVLRGPGSFTGLRVGLATALGFRQALGLPIVAPTTLEVLVAATVGVERWLTAPESGAISDGDRQVALVDALRDEWFVQVWRTGPPPTPEGEPERRAVDDLHRLAPATLVGFGVQALAPRLPDGLRLVEPPPLAPTLARLAAAAAWPWDETSLTRPLYLRAPAVHGA